MYKKTYNFDNVSFTIISKELDTFKNQIKHISQFYIPNDKLSNFNIEIEYIESEDLFKYTLNMLEGIIPKKYQSFENQIHNEYFVDGIKYYVIDNKEYLCIKENDMKYKIVSDGRLVSTKWPFRIVREILMRVNESNYALTMHATALTINDKGILIVGNKCSGKTTLATKILGTEENINFLSNDRIFMYDRESPVMEYFPIPVVLAMGTVKNNKNLDKYFIQSKILEKRTGIKYNESTDNDKVDIPLMDIPKIFSNSNMVSSSNIDLIIFSQLNQNSMISIKDINKKRKKVLLNQTCFTPFDSESLRLEWIYKKSISMNDLIENKIDTISNVINDVPIVEFDYSYNTDGELILKKVKEII